MTRVEVCRIGRVFFAGLASLVLLAAPARAAVVTLNFSGTVDLSVAGLPADTVFSGFFTWDSAALPFESHSGDAVYDLTAYKFIVNGDDMTLPILGDGTGNGVQVANNTDVFNDGTSVDALVFFAGLPVMGPGGNNIIFVGVLGGPTSMFDSLHLPGNLGFLPLTTGFSAWLEEVTGDVDEATSLSSGTFAASAPASVPEPATLGLTAIALAGVAARNRRRRSSTLP